MPLDVVCASDKGPFGLSWDAWVAIGTIFLAAVTAAAVILPIFTAWRQRIDRAARLAILLDHELVMFYGSMIRRGLETAPNRRTAEHIEAAIEDFFESNRTLNLPMLDKFVDKLEAFPPEVAARLGFVLSAVMSAKANKPEPMPMDAHIAAKILEVAHDESVVLAVRARGAIDVLRPCADKNITFPSLGEIPQWIRERCEDLKKQHHGKDLPF